MDADTFAHAIPFWPGGFRLHWRAPGLYALYTSGALWPLTWPQVLARILSGCTVRLVWLDAPDDTPLAVKAAVTVADRADLAQLFAAWNTQDWRRERQVAA